MRADTVVDPAERTARRERRVPREPAARFVAGLMRRDVLGVRLGVLLVILPVFVASMAMQIVSRQMWNHPPDSRYYLPMMARDMGHSISESVQMNRDVSPSWHLSGWYFADNDPTWQMVRTRLLYPVLSIPFVWMWGLSGGSLAIPVLGDILFLWAVARILQRLYGPAVAIIVTGAFTVTVPVFGFAWAGTDTLAMGLAAVIVANLPIERRIGKANLVWLGAASVFIALTRQVGVLAPAMAGAGWLWTLVRERDWRNRWLGSLIVTAATTVFVQLVSMAVVQADTAGVISHGQTTIFGILRTFVHYLKIVTQEAVTYMWHNDRVLLGILVAAGVGMAVRFTSDAAAVFFGGVCATYVITAGVGFSSFMRYEMILFPAAAVAAGAMLQLLLGEPDSRSDSDSGADPETVESTPGTRSDRWKPQLVFNIAVLAVVLGVSLPGSWSSAAAAPPSPSYAAAQGGRPYALPPLAKPGAEVTLNAVFNQTFGMAAGSGVIQGALDWVHVVRYRPTAPDQPGWSTRAKDGTTLIHPNSMDQDPDAQKAFGRALSLNRTVRSDTVKILSRQVSEYGEDVVFTVLDNSGTVHRGTATTLYPVWDKRDPGVITALVFDN